MQREPEWSTRDRLAMEALTFLEAQTCRGCGHPLEESTSPDFVAVVESDVCYGCRAKDIVHRDMAAKFKDEKPASGRPGWADGLRLWARPATHLEVSRAIRPE